MRITDRNLSSQTTKDFPMRGPLSNSRIKSVSWITPVRMSSRLILKAIHKSLPAHRLLLAWFIGLLITAALFTLAVRASGVPPQLIQLPILKLAIVAIAGPLALLGLMATVSILDNTEIKRKMCVITTGGGSSFIKVEEITTIRTRPGPRGSLAVRIVYERNGKRRVRTRWAPASLDRDRLDTVVEELLRRARDHAYA